MSNVLVTGGAGFIGSHLVDELCAQGHGVTVIDLLTTGNVANLATSMGSIRFVNGSILDEALVNDLVGQTDLVFHLAAAVGVRHIIDDPLDSMITNVRGTETVLQACARQWKRVLVASTSEVYGDPLKMPMSEDDDRVLGPTAIHRWSYSTSKALDEHYALALADKGLPVSIVRYFNTYGPRLDPRGYGSVLAQFLRQAIAEEPITVHGNGLQTRCFSYVGDIVRGTILAATREAALGTVINLGDPVEITILDLAEKVRALVGTNSEIQFVPYDVAYGHSFADTRRRVPDISRAKALLSWEPILDLDAGMGLTYKWWTTTFG